MFPAASVDVQVTVVDPIGKVAGALFVIVGTPQLSVPVGAVPKLTPLAVHVPASTEGFDHVDVGGQRDGLAGTRRVTVDRSVPRHPRQSREGNDIGDGSDIDEGRPSCDRKSGQGKALDRREGRNGGPTEMEECPTLPADHVRVWQWRRLLQIAEITQDGLTLELQCLARLAGSA